MLLPLHGYDNANSCRQVVADFDDLKVKDSIAQKLSYMSEAAAKDLEAKKLAFLELGMKEEKAISTVVTETKAPSDLDDEPLLRENPGRFVMFPLNYHEVRV